MPTEFAFVFIYLQTEHILFYFVFDFILIRIDQYSQVGKTVEHGKFYFKLCILEVKTFKQAMLDILIPIGKYLHYLRD